MIGVGAFCYIATHLGLYIADQMFDLWKVASEIALRLYLTIGFVAWLGLAALALTSTDAMPRRPGGRAAVEHQLVGRGILLPQLAILQVARIELPAALALVEPLLQALALLLLGNVQHVFAVSAF